MLLQNTRLIEGPSVGRSVDVMPLGVAPTLPRDRDSLHTAGRVEIGLEARVARENDALPCRAPDARAVWCLQAVDAYGGKGQREDNGTWRDKERTFAHGGAAAARLDRERRVKAVKSGYVLELRRMLGSEVGTYHS